MNNKKEATYSGILELDRENLCVVDGVVFEKESFQRYIREEHRPHPKKPDPRIENGAKTVSAEHPSSSVSSVSSFSGSMPKFTSFTSFSSDSVQKPTSGSAFLKGGYGIDLI